MKIVLASALFPPDIAAPAPYIKELAARLAPVHSITAVVYGRLPEQVAGAKIIAIDKRQPLLSRLPAYTRALWKATRGADILFVENGASVELPALLVTLFSKTALYLHFGDEAARVRADNSFFLHVLEKILLGHARGVITESPLIRPEILPFAPRPEQEFSAYEVSWQKHYAMLEKIFTNGN